MGKKTVIIDTNIFIAALGWDGLPRQLFLGILKGAYALIMPYEQLEELKRVLHYDYLEFNEEERYFLIGILEAKAHIIQTRKTRRLVKHDVDNALLEAAEAVNAEFLITGDKELLKLRRHNSTIILTPKAFLERNR